MATLALQAGVHPKVVQEQLGHSAINVTMDIYSQVPQAVAPREREQALFGSAELHEVAGDRHE
jgi:integrase